MSIIGIVGCPRTGKSTLCSALIEKWSRSVADVPAVFGRTNIFGNETAVRFTQVDQRNTIVVFKGIQYLSDDSLMYIDKYFKYLDSILFVTDKTPFADEREQDLYGYICTLVNNNASKKYQEVIVVVNKYDRISETTRKETMEYVQRFVRTPIYLISAYAKIAQNDSMLDISNEDVSLIVHLKQFYEGDHDTDKLFTVLNEDLSTKRSIHAIKWIKWKLQSLEPIYDSLPSILDLLGNVGRSEENQKKLESMLTLWSSSAYIDYISQLVIIYRIMKPFELSLFSCLRILKPCPLSCIYYAYTNDMESLAAFIGHPWTLRGKITLDPTIRDFVEYFKELAEVTVGDLIVAMFNIYKLRRRSVSDKDIIDLIQNIDIRRFLLLKYKSPKELMNGLLTRPSKYETIVKKYIEATNAQFTMDDFRRSVIDKWPMGDLPDSLHRPIGELVNNQ